MFDDRPEIIAGEAEILPEKVLKIIDDFIRLQRGTDFRYADVLVKLNYVHFEEKGALSQKIQNTV